MSREGFYYSISAVVNDTDPDESKLLQELYDTSPDEVFNDFELNIGDYIKGGPDVRGGQWADFRNSNPMWDDEFIPHTQEFSKKYPDVIFEIHWDGEYDSKGYYYIQNGKIQTAKGEVVYPDFNPDLLKDNFASAQ